MSRLRVNKIEEFTSGEGVSIAGVRTKGPLFDVTHPDYGAEGDNTTNDATAIDAADAAVATGGQVFFPRGRYKLTSVITKAGFSDWVGVRGTAPPASTNFGTVIVAGYNGDLVNFPTTGSEYCTYAGIRGISFYSPGLDTYASAIAIESNGNTRQVVIEDAVIDGFLIGVNGPWGELYLERVFIFNGKYGVFSAEPSDCWFSHVHAGSGTAAAAAASGGAGFFIAKGNTVVFESCRGQVQMGGPGFDLRSSTRLTLQSCIADINDTYGIVLINCHQVDIDSPLVFDNGTVASNGKGIRIEAISDTFTADAATDEITLTSLNSAHYFGALHTIVEFSNSGGALPTGLSSGTEYYLIAGSSSGKFKVATSYANAAAGTAVNITAAGSGTNSILGVVRDVRIMGGAIYDRNTGLATERQDVGIQFIKTSLNSAASGKIKNVTIEGVDLSRVATPIQFTNSVDSGLRIVNCAGVREEALASSSTQTFKVGENPPIQLFNNALAADVDVTLSQDGAYPGAYYEISRGVLATGAFNLNIKNSTGSTIASIAADATNVQMARAVYFGGAVNQWTLVKSAGF